MRIIERVNNFQLCSEILTLIDRHDINKVYTRFESLNDDDIFYMKSILADYFINLVDFRKGYEIANEILPLALNKQMIELEGIIRFQKNYALIWVGEFEELQYNLTEFKNRLSSITSNKELSLWNCYISFIEGVHNYRIGNYDQGEKLLRLSLKQAKDIGKRIHIAYRHLFLGILYVEIGAIDLAEVNLMISKMLAIDIKNLGIEYWSIFWTAVGDLKIDRFTEATKKFNECQSFILKKKYYSNWIEAYLRHSLAKLYYLQDNFLKAKENYIESLSIRELNFDFIGMSQCLFDLIIIELEDNNLSKAMFYLEILNTNYKKNNNSLIHCRYQIAKALTQKNKERLYDKALAFKTLKDILEKKSLNEELKVIAVLETCDLLIIEFQATGCNAPLEEIHSLLEDLNKSLEGKRTKYSLQIETLLFRSQIFLLQGNIVEANRLINEARKLVDKHNTLSAKFSPKIERKQEYIIEQLNKWKNALADQKVEDIRIELNEVHLTNYIRDLRKISKEYGFKFTGN